MSPKSRLTRRKQRRTNGHVDARQAEAEVVDQTGADEEQVEEDAPETQERDEELDKRTEVWEAFKEEFFETVEQLPLSLERHFALIRELDEHVHGYQSSLLPMLQRYTEWRRLRAGVVATNNDELQVSQQPDTPRDADSVPDASGGTTASADPPRTPHTDRGSDSFDKMDSLASAAERVRAQLASSPKLLPPQNSTQAQVLLSRVARLSEEMVSASQEKVNVAKSTYDTVDRHIRLLDQAIKEQELSLSHGLRPGTLPAPIVLPDLTIPKRQTRNHQSPAPGDVEDMIVDVLDQPGVSADVEEAPAMGFVSEATEGRVAPRRRGKKGRAKKKSVDEKADQSAPLPSATTNIKSIKLTVSPMVPAVSQVADMSANPDEPRYCFCNQVSYGEMIACDNPSCEREWFHYGCVDLTEAPRGKWFCRDCKDVNTRPRTKKGRRKRP